MVADAMVMNTRAPMHGFDVKKTMSVSSVSTGSGSPHSSAPSPSRAHADFESAAAHLDEAMHMGQHSNSRRGNRPSFGLKRWSSISEQSTCEPDQMEEMFEVNAQNMHEPSGAYPRRRWASMSEDDASPSTWPFWNPAVRTHGSFRGPMSGQQSPTQAMSNSNPQVRGGLSTHPPRLVQAPGPGGDFAPQHAYYQQVMPPVQQPVVPGAMAGQQRYPMGMPQGGTQPYAFPQMMMQATPPYPHAPMPYGQMPYATVPYMTIPPHAPNLQGIGHPAQHPMAGGQEMGSMMRPMGGIHMNRSSPTSGCSVTNSFSSPDVSPVSRRQTARPPATRKSTMSSSDSAPWTLIWVSDQAFKAAAGPRKAQMDDLGCATKGYKTPKNFIRALDKKRTMSKAVVLVGAADALTVIKYFEERGFKDTPVVAYGTLREREAHDLGNASACCQVAADFDAALDIITQNYV